VAASFHSPQRSQPGAYAGSPTPAAARPFVPFQSELQHDPMRSGPTTSSRPAYESALGTAQYSFPPPPPPPQHQNYPPGSTPRAPPPGYHYARPMTQSYSGSSSVIPSGLVGPEQSSAKYECQYCGKGFTRPSSLKVRFLALRFVHQEWKRTEFPSRLYQIHVHSHTGERRKFPPIHSSAHPRGLTRACHSVSMHLRGMQPNVQRAEQHASPRAHSSAVGKRGSRERRRRRERGGLSPATGAGNPGASSTASMMMMMNPGT